MNNTLSNSIRFRIYASYKKTLLNWHDCHNTPCHAYATVFTVCIRELILICVYQRVYPYLCISGSLSLPVCIRELNLTCVHQGVDPYLCASGSLSLPVCIRELPHVVPHSCWQEVSGALLRIPGVPYHSFSLTVFSSTKLPASISFSWPFNNC